MASDGFLCPDGLLAPIKPTGRANAVRQPLASAIRASAGTHHIQRVMGAAAISTGFRMATLGIWHFYSLFVLSAGDRASGTHIQFCLGERPGKRPGRFAVLRTALAPPLIPIFTT